MFEQVWTSLDKFRKYQTCLDKFREYFAILIWWWLLFHFSQFVSFTHNSQYGIQNNVILQWYSWFGFLCTSLNNFRQFWTSSDKFEQVWTCLTYLPLLLFPCWIKESFSLPLFILLHISIIPHGSPELVRVGRRHLQLKDALNYKPLLNTSRTWLQGTL